MRIKWQGEDLGEYSGVPTIRECRFIKQQIKMLPNDFQQALDDADPDATAIMVAILKARKGEDIDWREIDGELEDLDVTYNAAEKKMMKEAQEAQKKAAEGNDEDAGKGSVRLTGITGGKSTASQTSTKRSANTRAKSGSTSDSPS